jgi:predicted TIM-barrel fold metal-dependent hydrolase
MTIRDPLVDVHAHFLTRGYVVAATAAGHHSPDGLPAWPRRSSDEKLDLMDHTGIEVAMLSISGPGTHFGDDAAARALARHVNDDAAALVDRHPGRFGQEVVERARVHRLHPRAATPRQRYDLARSLS